MEIARGTNLMTLIPELATELSRVAHPRDEHAVRLVDSITTNGLQTADDAHAAFVALAGILNDYALPGHFFGPRPGEPTSFGYWEIESYEMNAIRHELGQIDEEVLREVYEPKDKKGKRKKERPQISVAEKIQEAKDSLAVIEELQETGALFVHNNSGGKDSQAMLVYMIEVLGIPAQQIVSVHADLGAMEWEHPGKKKTREIAEDIARHYGVEFYVVTHTRDIPLTERVTERVMTHVVKGRYEEREGGGHELVASPFPSAGERWCTSEFKTAPCEQFASDLAAEQHRGQGIYSRMDATSALLQGEKEDREKKIENLAPRTVQKRTGMERVKPVFIVHALGLRSEESDDRGFEPVLRLKHFTARSTKTGTPLYQWRWLPIQLLSTEEVFRMIRAANQEPHWIYGEGMSRASCSFCIYASPSDMKLAAKLRPDLYAQYVALEHHYGKSFSLRREFLEDMTKIQADEALVSQYRRDLVPVEELIEKYGGVFRDKRPSEEELAPYRRAGFREEEQLIPPGTLTRRR